MRKIIISAIALFIICGSAEAQLIRFKVDTVKATEGIKIKNIDRTSFFDNLDSGNQTTTPSIGDSTITRPKLSTTVNVLLNNPGSGIAYPPDDVSLEFKISGPDTSVGTKDSYIGGLISDSIAFPVDTTALKLLNMAEGRVAYLRGLDATNNPKYGGQMFVVKDSSDLDAMFDSLVTGIVLYNHSTDGMFWASDLYLNYREINVLWGGAYPDSTNSSATTTAINNVFEDAFWLGTHDTFIPSGVYAIADTHASMYPKAVVHGTLNSKISQEDSTKQVMMNHQGNLPSGVDSTENTYHVYDLVLEGSSVHGFEPDEYDSTPNQAALFIQKASGVNNFVKRAIVENVICQRTESGGVFIRADEAIVRNCIVNNTNFTAYSIAARYAEISNCTGNYNIFGLEMYSLNTIFNGANTVYDDVMKINGFYMTNLYRYGVRSYTGTRFSMNNFFLGTVDTFATAIGEYHGIWITSKYRDHTLENWQNVSGDIWYSTSNSRLATNPSYVTFDGVVGTRSSSKVLMDAEKEWWWTGAGDDTMYVYTSDTTNIQFHLSLSAPYTRKSVEITNGEIRNFADRGIYIGKELIADTSLGDIKIDNVRTERCLSGGIEIIPAEANDVGKVIITNSELIDNNLSYANGYAQCGIVLAYGDSAIIRDNIVFQADSATAGEFPIYFNNSTGALIEDNDFRSPYGATIGETIIVDSASTDYIIKNNQGLDWDNAVYNWINTTYYKQDMWVENDVIGFSDDTRGTAAFTNTDVSDTVLISGASAADYYILTVTGTAVDTLDILMSSPRADSLIIFRPAGGTSGLAWDWFRIK